MMKKSIFSWIVILFLPCTLALAQMTSSGNFVIGSSFGLSSAQSNIKHIDGSGDSEGDGPSSMQFNISPKVGYFISDNFALGIGMDYTFSEVEDPNLNRTKDTDLLFGPFARLYLPVGGDIAVFLEGNFGFGTSSDIMNIGGENQNISTNIFAVGAGPGLTIFSSEAIGISASFKYNYARSDFDTEIGGIKRQTITKTNQFDFSVGVQVYFTALKSAASSNNRFFE
jgi:hypothetical protein